MDSRIDIEKTQKIVALAMEKIKAEVDPWLLDEYHQAFKKEVSLFHRSRVAAYLLMLLDQGKGPRFLEQTGHGAKGGKPAGRGGPARQEKGGPRRKGGGERAFQPGDAPRAGAAGGATGGGAGGADPQRYPLADEDSKWLFFSVGRSRRISPREILSLINTKTALPKDDIGAIRILDNYSFVQVRDTAAEKIIEALSGYIFRGRPLAVNYARSRKDEGDDAAYGEEPAERAFSAASRPAPESLSDDLPADGSDGAYEPEPAGQFGEPAQGRSAEAPDEPAALGDEPEQDEPEARGEPRDEPAAAQDETGAGGPDEPLAEPKAEPPAEGASEQDGEDEPQEKNV